MSRRRALAPLALSLLLSAATLRAEKETFVLDKNHTQIGFRVRHFVSKVGGRFGRFQGTITLDRAKPEESAVELRIEAASIDTGIANRDKHLNSADFFDTAKYPDITFRSTRIAAKGNDTYEVTGDLTMRGVTKPVTLTVVSNGFANDGRGGQKAGFDVTGKLNRKDFGVSWNAVVDQTTMLSDDVDLEIAVEANEPGPKPAVPPAQAPAAPAPAPATK
ncbi:MAG TPA: YceI family protein [Thermoanaerobaculia bacterium]|nr:YceI family protein [Thermoanaerobaculia bacterium]